MRKTLPLILALIVLISSSICFSSAATIVDAGAMGDLIWRLDSEGTLTFSGTGIVGDGKNTSPWGNDIKKVELCEGITKLNGSAFRYCDKITSIELPESVTEIGGYTFANCTALETIKMNGNVSVIKTAAFFGCTNLKSIDLTNVTQIDGYAFKDCQSLTELVIPDSVVSLGDELTFSGCTGLRTLVIGNGVTRIPSSAFINCSGLESAVVPESVTSIGSYAFDDCSAIKDIYYTGTQEQWNAIEIDHDNKVLYMAAIHCEHKIELQSAAAESAKYLFNGQRQHPDVAVYDIYGNRLTKDRDYTLEYEGDCKDPGTYTVTVKGTGHYTGELETSFTIDYLPGDVNLDGKVTAADARLALRRAVGLETYAEGSAQFRAADVNFDGKITASDARRILRAAVGLEKLS